MSRVKAGEAYVAISAKTSDLESGLLRAQARLTAFANTARRAGLTMSLAAAAPIAGLGKAVSTFGGFDDAIRGVFATMSGATDGEKEDLKSLARELGSTTSYMASEVASLMEVLSRAGFVAGDVGKMTEPILALGRATGKDLSLAAQVTAVALRQFKKEASETQKVVDQLAATAENSFTDLDEIGEALKWSGTFAADRGESLEATLAAIGQLANLGIKGGSAGTAIKKMLASTATEIDKFKKTLNVDLTDTNLIESMELIGSAMSELSGVEKSQVLNDLFGLEGLVGASALSGTAADVRILMQKIEQAGGTASRSAIGRDAGIGGTMRRAMSAVEGLAIAIGEALAPALSVIVDKMVVAVNWFEKFASENKTLVTIIAASIAAIGVAGATLLTLSAVATVVASSIAAFTAAASTIGPAVAAISAPVLATVAAVRALSIVWSSTSNDVTTFAGAIKQSVRDMASFVKDVIVDMVSAIVSGDIAGAFAVAADSLKVSFLSAIDFISDAFSVFIGGIKSGLVDVISVVQKTYAKIKSVMPFGGDYSTEVKRIDIETAAKKEAIERDVAQRVGMYSAPERARYASIIPEKSIARIRPELVSNQAPGIASVSVNSVESRAVSPSAESAIIETAAILRQMLNRMQTSAPTGVYS